MTLQNRHDGQPVTSRGRAIAFSFWPSRTTPQGPVAQTKLFAIDPWAIIRQVVENDCPVGRRTEALACLTQAQAFFEVGTGQGNEAARPVALYYSYLNAAKAYCLTRGTAGTLDGASHGLKAHGRNKIYDFADTYLQTVPSGTTHGGVPKPEMFDEMMSVLTGGTAPQPSYEMAALAPQI